MNEHPVPQNVTQFEFKLVGDMTIKQFGYVGSGLGLAYLIFVSMASGAPFLAYPLMVLCALVGVALAFLPFQDRPLDHWAKAFFGAVFSPTRGSFKSKSVSTTEPIFDNRLKVYLNDEPPQLVQKAASLSVASAQMAPVTQALVEPEVNITPTVSAPAQMPQPVQSPQIPKMEVPSQSEEAAIQDKKDLKQVVEYAKTAQILQNQIISAERELLDIKNRAMEPNQDPKVINAQFRNVLTRLETFNKQAKVMSDELSRLSDGGSGVEVFKPTSVAAPSVRIQASSLENYASLTSVANIINGVVYDAAGNYLTGVIVVAHDKDNLPVRALKTNKLGQFLAATPLPNGVYTLTFEKESLNFDTVELELDGKILPALKVTAKKGI